LIPSLLFDQVFNLAAIIFTLVLPIS